VSDVYLTSSSRKKIVSNDLGRLYRMGFLKRRRMKRLCPSLRGPPCNRGFQYRYSLSKRGLGYVRWLGEGKPAQDVAYAQLRSEALSNLSEEDRKAVMAGHVVEASSRYKGPGSNPKPAASDLLVNIRLADRNRNLTADIQELSKAFLYEAIEVTKLSGEKEIERLKNVLVEGSLERLKNEYNRFFDVSMNTLVDQAILDRSLFRVTRRIADLYRDILEQTLAVLALIFPGEAVDRLISFVIESEKPLIDSIIREFKSLKTSEKPTQMKSTMAQPKTTVIIEEHYVADSTNSIVSKTEIPDPHGKNTRKTIREIVEEECRPKTGIVEIELFGLNSKTSSQLAFLTNNTSSVNLFYLAVFAA